ncbi:MAG: prolipoprotein diacylglyceryl transferase [Clostridiaceae bacterium]|nr:prolipoprotein diacylglyceryl transferase [Clostridiaceae bacterium]
MNPIALTILGFSITWYGILIGSGIMIAFFLAQYTCKIKNISYDTILNIALISLPIGIVGARLYYVIFNWDVYKMEPMQVFNTRGGGLAIHGGLIFGLLAALVYTYIKKIDFLTYVDAAAPTIIIAQALGRWGNFINSEAHGREVSTEFIKHFPSFIQKGMYISEGNLPAVYYHPTFLYESVWNLIVFFILMIILRKSNKKGTVIFSYIFLYSLGRFFIEALRTDSLMLGPLRVAQCVSLVAMVISLAYITYNYFRKHH